MSLGYKFECLCDKTRGCGIHIHDVSYLSNMDYYYFQRWGEIPQRIVCDHTAEVALCQQLTMETDVNKLHTLLLQIVKDNLSGHIRNYMNQRGHKFTIKLWNLANISSKCLRIPLYNAAQSVYHESVKLKRVRNIPVCQSDHIRSKPILSQCDDASDVEIDPRIVVEQCDIKPDLEPRDISITNNDCHPRDIELREPCNIELREPCNIEPREPCNEPRDIEPREPCNEPRDIKPDIDCVIIDDITVNHKRSKFYTSKYRNRLSPYHKRSK
jgi:hypothetical protein